MNMNRVFLLTAGLLLTLSTQAQNDTTVTGKKDNWHPGGDTLRVGNLLIIRNGPAQYMSDPYIRIRNRHHDRGYRPSNISTNWGIVDLGFTNYKQKNKYSSSPPPHLSPRGGTER